MDLRQYYKIDKMLNAKIKRIIEMVLLILFPLTNKLKSFSPRRITKLLRLLSMSPSSNIIYPSQDFQKVVGISVPELIRNYYLDGNGTCTIMEGFATGYKLSFNDVQRHTRSFACALAQAGFKPGEVVTICLRNRPEYIPISYGIWDAGMVVSTMDPNFKFLEMKSQLADSGSSCIVTYPEMVKIAKQVQESLAPQVRAIIVVGDAKEGCYTYSEMIKTDASSFSPHISPGENELALLVFSSGTTGKPKAVMHSHAGLCTSIAQTKSVDFLQMQACLGNSTVQDRIVGQLSMFHIFGFFCYSFIAPMHRTHTLFLQTFVKADYDAAIKRQKPTTLELVAPLVLHLVSNSTTVTEDFESVRSCTVGATPTDPLLASRLLDKIGREIPFRNAYGMTEVLLATVTVVEPTRNFKTIGSLVPGVLGKVVDIDCKDIEMGPYQTGEFAIRGPQVLLGYLNNPKATAETIVDGWIYTGDLVYHDEGYHFYIVDRIKDIIRVRGKQVSPTEIEECIRKLPEIADVTVIGIPDAVDGQLPRAYVVRKPNTKLTEEDVKKHVEDNLSHIKKLKGGVKFLDALPKSFVGKALRRILVDEYMNSLNEKT